MGCILKIRNYFEFAGLKRKPRKYSYQLEAFQLAGNTYHFAHWKHPKYVREIITEETVSQLRDFINEGDFCIDIGAHMGDSTLPIAIAAGCTGKVLALEPNPFIYQ